MDKNLSNEVWARQAVARVVRSACVLGAVELLLLQQQVRP